MENLLAEQYYMEKEAKRRHRMLRSQIAKKYLMSIIAVYLQSRANDEPKDEEEEKRVKSLLDAIDRDSTFEYDYWGDGRSIGPRHMKQRVKEFVHYLREDYEHDYFDSHSELCAFAWGLTVKLKKCGKQDKPIKWKSCLQRYKQKVLEELEQQMYAQIALNLIGGEEERVIELEEDCDILERHPKDGLGLSL